ncbi:MAG: PH domain-containing protein [Candidatus Cloacimonadaceae bacterium]|nr:PH domain-containing protein [Candidatus Cloacimonadaceae bacterium]
MFLIVLYIPAFFKTLLYTMDRDAIILRKGVFWKKQTTVPYHKITNIDLTQDPVERLYQLWSLHIQTAGAGGQQGNNAEIIILGIKDGEAFKVAIMKRVKQLYKTDEDIPLTVNPTLGESGVLQAMLRELQAIREALQK